VKSRLQTLWPCSAAVLSGLLLTLCFPPFDQGWLCWIALTPLISALWFSYENGRRVWLKKTGLGYLTGLTFFTLTFKWLSCLAGLFGSRWLALIPPLLALYLAVYFAFWGWFVGVFIKDRQFLQSRRNLWTAFLCAAAWVPHEWVRGWMFGGFGWNGLGVGLHGNLALIQIADITGIWGLSFLVAFTNIIAVITVRRLLGEIGRVRLRPHYDFSLTIALVVVVFSYGVRTLLKKEEGTPLRVAAIQANIPQDEKSDADSMKNIEESYTRLTELALKLEPQLLIWPESSVPGGLFSSKETFDFVNGFTAGKPGLNFLVGTDDFDEKDSYNAAVLLTDNGKGPQAYHKIHLVPFGEYIPLRHSFPLFAWFAGGMVPGDFKAGTEYTVLETQNPPVKIAPLICFEDTVGDLTRRFVLKGAQVLVNITNDGWFQKTEGAEQHLANAVFRAVETRRPLVRAANTGITCFVDACGRVTQTAPPFTESMLTGSIKIQQPTTLYFYVKYGDYIPISLLAFTCIYITIFFLRFNQQIK
jgi:apolipoprotein N-acyltransferase